MIAYYQDSGVAGAAHAAVCHNRRIRRLGFAHYDAYIIAPTGHAASYVLPTGGSLTRPNKTSLRQRVSRAWKHIGGKIRNHCSCLITLRSTLHNRVGPTCRGINALCIRTPWSIKGGRIGSYTTKIKTSPSGCRVLRSGGPNHSKSCVLVCFLPKLDHPNRQSTSQSPPSLGIGGCAPPPDCGYPRNPTTVGTL